MSRSPQSDLETQPRVQTSLRLPRGLWRAVKFCAVTEEIDLQGLVARALEQYLEKTLPAGAQEALGEYLVYRTSRTSPRRQQGRAKGQP